MIRRTPLARLASTVAAAGVGALLAVTLSAPTHAVTPRVEGTFTYLDKHSGKPLTITPTGPGCISPLEGFQPVTNNLRYPSDYNGPRHKWSVVFYSKPNCDNNAGTSVKVEPGASSDGNRAFQSINVTDEPLSDLVGSPGSNLLGD